MLRKYFAQVLIPAALELLPEVYRSQDAKRMLLAISIQESGLSYRSQIKGPAKGYWQFEPVGVAGVLRHYSTEDQAANLLKHLDYSPLDSVSVYHALEHNDVLACCIARLLLWTLPEKLPGFKDTEIAWDQYRKVWRPGKPRYEDWPGSWSIALMYYPED